MWSDLPETERREYKRRILSFSSLSSLMAQKADSSGSPLTPEIPSKYQEKAFQKSFGAKAEDIGNQPFDVSVIKEIGGEEHRYLVGIKTFTFSNGRQKIAQFKRDSLQWNSLVNEIVRNAEKYNTKDEVDSVNSDLYLDLARKVSARRNERMDSAVAQISGFRADPSDSNLELVYHVLMPERNGSKPVIHLGETDYSKIDIGNIRILGCTGVKNPRNFDFTDGKHYYSYTSADSQLLMDFRNSNIVLEDWDVKFSPDPDALIRYIYRTVYEEFLDSEPDVPAHESPKITESYCWFISGKDGEPERYSGFNAFFGTGSKLSRDSRRKIIDSLDEYNGTVPDSILSDVQSDLEHYLLGPSVRNDSARSNLERLRVKIRESADRSGNMDFADRVTKILYRPQSEMYIPIPASVKFHRAHPDFFGKGIGTFKNDGKSLALPKEERKFMLIFEPSGNEIESFITQDGGKAIESYEKQSYLGKWVLQKVFGLKPYEPLTSEAMERVGINGIRLYRTDADSGVHLEFIKIDSDNLPGDLMDNALPNIGARGLICF